MFYWYRSYISQLFALLYYGESFAICGKVILTLTPLIYIVSIGDIIRQQYIVPKAMDKWLVISYTINAIVNLILTFILIPRIGIYGAVIGTIAAETVGLIFQIILCKNFMSLKELLLVTIPYLIFGIIMFFVIFIIKKFMNDSWFDLIIQIAAGGVVYCILGGVYLLFLSPIKNEVKNLIFHRKK